MSAVVDTQGIEVVKVRDGNGGLSDIERTGIMLPGLKIFHITSAYLIKV